MKRLVLEWQREEEAELVCRTLDVVRFKAFGEALCTAKLDTMYETWTLEVSCVGSKRLRQNETFCRE